MHSCMQCLFSASITIEEYIYIHITVGIFILYIVYTQNLLSVIPLYSTDVSQSSSYIPRDNPVYGIPEHKRSVTITSEVAEFDNPKYGSNYELIDALIACYRLLMTVDSML